MRIARAIVFLLPIITIIPSANSCRKDEPCTTCPPPYVRSIELAVVDTGVTETWLHVHFLDTIQSRAFALSRDGQTVLTAQSSPLDTLVVDTALLPNRPYTYKAYRLTNNQLTDSSNLISFTTMDTTSHNFTWQMYTLGDGSSSVLYDVAIINDTLAYAVGEIFLRDSTGELDPVYYNLAKWDGLKWELTRIKSNCRYYYPYCGPETLAVAPGNSVFSFAPNDIWIAAGGVHHFDGVQWTEQRAIVEAGTANAIWGTNSNDLWFVGNNGLIVHHNLGVWQRIESGTTAIMVDIRGHGNLSKGNSVLTVAGATSSEGARILSLSPTGVRDTLSPPTERLGGIWLSNRSAVYVCGSGIWRYKQTGWRQITGLPSSMFFIRSIRGSDENNIFAIAGWTLMHFNGKTWHEFAELPTDFRYQAIAVSQNVVVAVGYTLSGIWADKATIVVGRRVE